MRSDNDLKETGSINTKTNEGANEMINRIQVNIMTNQTTEALFTRERSRGKRTNILVDVPFVYIFEA